MRLPGVGGPLDDLYSSSVEDVYTVGVCIPVVTYVVVQVVVVGTLARGPSTTRTVGGRRQPEPKKDQQLFFTPTQQLFFTPTVLYSLWCGTSMYLCKIQNKTYIYW